MEYKVFDEKMTSMLDKIGNEASSLILDDVTSFLTDNQKMNQELEEKNNEILRLQNLNSRLQQVNTNMLLQIPVNKEPKKEDEDLPKKKLSINEAFDEFGNFKK